MNSPFRGSIKILIELQKHFFGVSIGNISPALTFTHGPSLNSEFLRLKGQSLYTLPMFMVNLCILYKSVYNMYTYNVDPAVYDGPLEHKTSWSIIIYFMYWPIYVYFILGPIFLCILYLLVYLCIPYILVHLCILYLLTHLCILFLLDHLCIISQCWKISHNMFLLIGLSIIVFVGSMDGYYEILREI